MYISKGTREFLTKNSFHAGHNSFAFICDTAQFQYDNIFLHMKYDLINDNIFLQTIKCIFKNWCSISFVPESRSEPDFQTEIEACLYQSHRMCEQFVTFVTVTYGHKSGFLTEFISLVFLCFFSKTGLVTFWSQISQMVTVSIVTGTNLFLFLFRLKWFGVNETRKNMPESELCFCFLFEIRLWTALWSMTKQGTDSEPVLQTLRSTRPWINWNRTHLAQEAWTIWLPLRSCCVLPQSYHCPSLTRDIPFSSARSEFPYKK